MNLTLISIFFTVALAHFLALLSPGPDFVLIIKSTIKNGKRNSIGIVAGITSANAVYILLCLVGIGTLLASSVAILIFLKIAGGLFLIYLAVMALKAKKDDYNHLIANEITVNISTASFNKEFFTGFMSGILNPKNLLFYLSLFTVVLTKDVGLTFKIILGIWMTAMVFIWDIAIIYLLSTQKVRSKFSRFAYYIDKCTGVILGIIGVSIIKSALSR